MTTKYGMFLEHQYLQPGAAGALPPNPATDDRDKGLNFKATTARTGKTNDATFDKYKSLHEGDRYIDPLKRTLMANNESKKHQVVETPFKAASPMKKSPGLGDFYGTIQGKQEYIPGATVDVQKKRGDFQGEPKGMYTNPAKKGTYGYNKTTLSERQGHKGVATEYEYHAQPEALDRARRVAEREADKKARTSELPFKPANPPKRGGAGVANTTISKGKGIAGEWEYIVGADTREMKGTGKVESKVETPFKPSSLTTKHLGRQPEYIHDPEVPKMEAEAARKKAEHQRLAASGAWRPNMSYKTDMTRSIIRMNI